ncbi:MAG TPA: hypothetical protein VJ180_02450 [Pyrinomonadaceae bacterium]|nr:hypothetical protein [Pyrinomonadaceae bacterium]
MRHRKRLVVASKWVRGKRLRLEGCAGTIVQNIAVDLACQNASGQVYPQITQITQIKKDNVRLKPGEDSKVARFF